MKKTMKKATCMLMAAMVLTACGGSGGSSAPATTAAPSAPEKAGTPEETTAAAAPDQAAAGGTAFDASSFPSAPVTLVVPWKVGGGSDVSARAAANVFKNFTGGQPLVVSNIEGGSGVQGVSEYLTYEPSPYSLLSWATAQTIKTHMQDTKFSALDFRPVCGFVADSPYILVRTDSQFETIGDLVEYAKANPGVLTIGNSGTGGGNHLAALQLCLATGIEVNHIAYEGGAASSSAVLSGEIDCSMNMPAEGLASVEAGELRMLCLFAENRSEFWPDVPTAKESGIDVVNNQTRGVVINKDVPEEAAKALEAIFEQACQDESFKQSLKDLNINGVWLDAEAYGKTIEEENALYQEIVKSNGLGDKY